MYAYLCMYVYIHTYVYIYTHTFTHMCIPRMYIIAVRNISVVCNRT